MLHIPIRINCGEFFTSDSINLQSARLLSFKTPGCYASCYKTFKFHLFPFVRYDVLETNYYVKLLLLLLFDKFDLILSHAPITENL